MHPVDFEQSKFLLWFDRYKLQFRSTATNTAAHHHPSWAIDYYWVTQPYWWFLLRALIHRWNVKTINHKQKFFTMKVAQNLRHSSRTGVILLEFTCQSWTELSVPWIYPVMRTGRCRKIKIAIIRYDLPNSRYTATLPHVYLARPGKSSDVTWPLVLAGHWTGCLLLPKRTRTHPTALL